MPVKTEQHASNNAPLFTHWLLDRTSTKKEMKVKSVLLLNFHLSRKPTDVKSYQLFYYKDRFRFSHRLWSIYIFD